MASNAIFQDLNQYLPTNKPLLKDEEDIIQSLNNLLATQQLERLFNNEFGINFEDFLFELIDDITSVEVLRVVTQRVEIFEPRVTLNFATTTVEPDPDNNRYVIDLRYFIVGRETEGEQSLQGIVRR